MHERSVTIEQRPNGFMAAAFMAMASYCEVIIQTGDAALALRLGRLAAAEAWRIEDKFSRYRADSAVGRINASAGSPVEVDDETARLLDFAAQCHALSHGLFDITSGVLRRVWRFDGSDRVPDAAAVAAVCELVGFDKLQWRAPWLTLRADMEIDFGGIGKEYAADRALALASAGAAAPHPTPRKEAVALQVSLPVSKATIASRLSITPEYFSRVLHELESAGLISIERRQIHIEDCKALANYELQ
jgi:thiamine biosynthesis lipoprotein